MNIDSYRKMVSLYESSKELWHGTCCMLAQKTALRMNKNPSDAQRQYTYGRDITPFINYKTDRRIT